MQIIRYSQEYKELWNNFNSESKSGTFLIHRDFMEYHSARFVDHSLLFYDKDLLVALMPANLAGDTFHTHQGLTYGGLIVGRHTKTHQVVAILDKLIEYLKSQGIAKLVYKPIPHIYHTHPAEEELYALFRCNASLSARSISSTIDQTNKLAYAQLRKRQIKKAKSHNLLVSESKDLKAFWDILEQNLNDKYRTKPVHSLQEIEYLKDKFNTQIRLFCVSRDEETIAGCLVFETGSVAHVQYISANDEGKENGALDFLFDHLINQVFAEKKFFDFGISTENNGLYLNEGLIAQKEGFGARAIVYDTYQIELVD